ncbi:hypothetical protein CSB08_00300 [Candidatus Gracilibacteria bacterium]|nr:MAG: hypothetical protein CSB08_00300 [Candidatus Gracilibacteria bacterium]PIE85283.1 MAG: hypothetical protein CSA08_02650 [Candidatus Gracilibacteria bacterium]
MLGDIFSIIVLLILTFLPFLLWGYLFSYIDDSKFSRKRFLAGIFGGAISVFPILYMDKFFELFDFRYLNIFYYTFNIATIDSVFELGLSLTLSIVTISIFILFFYLKLFSKLKKVFFTHILIFIFFIFSLSLFLYFVNLFLQNFQSITGLNETVIYFGDIIFNSIRLIIFYYIIVGFVEETTKHFNFLGTSFLYIKSVKSGVLYAIFIALGFSFVENILYLYGNFIKLGLTSELVQIYFLRSIFSVVVHILCSSIVAYYFSRALLTYRKNNLNFPFIKVFFLGLFIGILLHAIFDITLTLGFSFVILIYFMFGYFYVTSIFYKE